MDLEDRCAHEDEEDERDPHDGESIASLEISCVSSPSPSADTHSPITVPTTYIPRTTADRA